MEKIKRILLLSFMIVITSACNLQLARNVSIATVAPTQLANPVPTGSPTNLPQTDNDVLRVSVQDAKVAFENAAAIIVDVRDPDAFAASHIAGAINIPLAEIAANPTGLKLDKNEWIITYCT